MKHLRTAGTFTLQPSTFNAHIRATNQIATEWQEPPHAGFHAIKGHYAASFKLPPMGVTELAAAAWAGWVSNRSFWSRI